MKTLERQQRGAQAVDGQTRAKIGRDRALKAMITYQDEMTRISLWKSAIRFNALMKMYMQAETGVAPVPLCL